MLETCGIFKGVTISDYYERVMIILELCVFVDNIIMLVRSGKYMIRTLDDVILELLLLSTPVMETALISSHAVSKY